MKDIISELIERLKSADKEWADAISNGANIHSFEIYQRHVGHLEGIRHAREILESILTEDDEQE